MSYFPAETAENEDSKSPRLSPIPPPPPPPTAFQEECKTRDSCQQFPEDLDLGVVRKNEEQNLSQPEVSQEQQTSISLRIQILPLNREFGNEPYQNEPECIIVLNPTN